MEPGNCLTSEWLIFSFEETRLCVLFQALCIWAVCDIVWNFRSLEGFESKNTSQALLPAFEF